MDLFKAYEISYEGMPATLAGADLRVLHDYRKLRFSLGTRAGRRVERSARARRGDRQRAVREQASCEGGRFDDDSRGRAQVARFRVVDVFYDYAQRARRDHRGSRDVAEVFS